MINMKIAVLSSHTQSLLWFRMDMMKYFINNGHTVIALGSEPEVEWKQKFAEDKIDYRQLPVDRNGVNILKDIKTVHALFRFMRKEKPDKVIAYHAKTVIYGSVAAKMNGITEIYLMIGGLGSVLRGTGFKNEILKLVMKAEYRISFQCSKRVFFENNDDKNAFIHRGLIKEDKTVLIDGVGVNLSVFKPVPIPVKPAFLFVGRLIKDKGIMEYLEACKMIKEKYPEVNCMLVGPYDSNPTAMKHQELEPYIEAGIINYYGEQSDVRPYLSECSVFVLPSYHEGMPKTVLEAMAMGRTIITSNAPGCKETVINGVNGYLVEIKNIKQLAEKMEYLLCNHALCSEMGMASYKLATEKYDVKIINKIIMETMGLINK